MLNFEPIHAFSLLFTILYFCYNNRGRFAYSNSKINLEFFEVSSTKGGGALNCSGVFFRRKNVQIQKFRCLKNNNFEIVNYILFGRFLAVLLRFSQKNVISNVVQKITAFFPRITTKPSKILQFVYR